MKLHIQARIEGGQIRLIITPNGIKTVLAIGQPMTFEASEIVIEDYDPGTIATVKQVGE